MRRRPLFTENDTNNEKIFGSSSASPYVKDGIDRYVVQGETGAVNPRAGPAPRPPSTMCSPHPGRPERGPSACVTAAAELPPDWTGDFDTVMAQRRFRQADEFYDACIPADAGADERRLVRQALAGVLWSKQYYYLDVERWLTEPRRRPAPLRPPGAEQQLVPHGQRRDHVDAGHLGVPVVRGLGPRLHTVALSMVDLHLRQGPVGPAACAASTLSTPTARSRPTNGTSGTSARPCTPGPPCSSTSWRSTAPARATAPSWRTPSRSRHV
ncbi:hypothetical protein ACRAWF_20050 [Streptomyces sp. L7]